MLLCDKCNEEMHEGQICGSCKQIICLKCQKGETCPFCRKEGRILFQIVREKKHNRNIEWVVFEGGERFGLVGFKELPSIAYELAQFHQLFSENYKLILFPSRKQSQTFARYQAKGEKIPIIGNNGGTIKESRYSILMGMGTTNETYVLLNVERTGESAVPFLLRFFNGLFINLKSMPLSDFNGASRIGEALLEAMHQYNSKFGAQFVYPSEYWKELSRDMFVKIKISYIENRTLTELSVNENLQGEVLDYVSNKISVFFNRTRELRLNSFQDLLNLIGLYEVSLTFMASLQTNTRLYAFAESKLQRANTSIQKKIGGHNDALIALETFREKMLQPKNYSDFQTFISSLANAVIDFFTALEPKYMWLEGAEPFAIACKGYLERIAMGAPTQHPMMGSVDDFIVLLTNVFDKIDAAPAIYPEPSLECGQVLLELLTNLVRYTKSEYYFKKALEQGTKLSDGIEKNAEFIAKNNPYSSFDHLQATAVLMELSTMCTNFRRWDITVELLDKAIGLAHKNNLTQIKLRAHWTKFMLTQDYEEALQVYKLHLSNIKVKNSEFKFPKVMSLMLSGIFEGRDRIKHFQEAADLSLDGQIDEQPDITTAYLLDELFAQRLSYYVSHLFLHVAKAEEMKDVNSILSELLKAKPFAIALEAESNIPIAFENVFSWKTMLLIGILNEDSKCTQECIRKLKAFPSKSQTNENFLTKAEMLLLPNTIENWNKKLQAFEAPIETRDLWSRLLEKIVETDFKNLLNKRLPLVSRAILFVEGPTELEVLPFMAEKVGVNLKKLGIELIPLGGGSKAKFKVKFWKEITKDISLPLFMVLDADAIDYSRMAVNEGLLKKGNSFVLSKGTIEDYYPMEQLIKPIEELCGKTPLPEELSGKKVPAITKYLKKNGYYGDWKITIGRKVAEAMEANAVNNEIKKIFRDIEEAV